MAGKTGRGQVSRSTGAAAPVVETDTVAVVAAEPGEAAALVAAEAGSAIAVICMRQGGKDERAVLDRALSAATERGCRSLGAPGWSMRLMVGPPTRCWPNSGGFVRTG